MRAHRAHPVAPSRTHTPAPLARASCRPHAIPYFSYDTLCFRCLRYRAAHTHSVCGTRCAEQVSMGTSPHTRTMAPHTYRRKDAPLSIAYTCLCMYPHIRSLYPENPRKMLVGGHQSDTFCPVKNPTMRHPRRVAYPQMWHMQAHILRSRAYFLHVWITSYGAHTACAGGASGTLFLSLAPGGHRTQTDTPPCDSPSSIAYIQSRVCVCVYVESGGDRRLFVFEKNYIAKARAPMKLKERL